MKLTQRLSTLLIASDDEPTTTPPCFSVSWEDAVRHGDRPLW